MLIADVFINGDGSSFMRLDGSGDEWILLGYILSNGCKSCWKNTIIFPNTWTYISVVRLMGI